MTSQKLCGHGRKGCENGSVHVQIIVAKESLLLAPAESVRQQELTADGLDRIAQELAVSLNRCLDSATPDGLAQSLQALEDAISGFTVSTGI